MPERKDAAETIVSLGTDAPRSTAAAAASPENTPAPADLGRYVDLAPLGRGGTAEVRRVLDRELGRALALKHLRVELAADTVARARFDAEARIVARLQHPGVVPIHEIGRLPDGRPYYTMNEVRGETLRDALREAHGALREGRTGRWTLRRLVEACFRACEAVAYAHAMGVLHRDLKPANVMLGGFGEVLVLDWGLAKELDAPRTDGEPSATATPSWRPRDSQLTAAGGVAGTPTHMPPEQARGEPVGRAADVYALGATLYEVLSGRAPYEGPNHWTVLVQLLQGPPPSVIEAAAAAGAPPVPDDLAALVERAMAREPDARFPDAGALAAELGAWLDGARRREQALALVAEADALLPEVRALRAEAARLREEAVAALVGVRTYDPVDKKRPAWALEDAAAEREREADLRELEVTRLLRSALTQLPTLEEAHARLADFHRERHAEAEDRGDARAARPHEVLLRQHDRSGRHADYLEGKGALTLHTDPAGAEVWLFRYELVDRRLVPQPVGLLGHTPLRAVELPMGSWLLEIVAPGCRRVRYPVCLRRNEHWHGRNPEGDVVVVPLPREEELDPEEIFVPPGWFWAGGDPLAPGAIPRQRVWIDGFVTTRFPVTIGEYLPWLHALLDDGREEEALRHALRERGTHHTELGALVLPLGEDRRFRLAFTDGMETPPTWPACMIRPASARAWCAWRAAATGKAWRLPWELEWEKAARGVDGRLFPWGDVLDATWACMRDTHPGTPTIHPVDSFPVDESPWGVRGMAGNMRSFCADAWVSEGPTIRGGRHHPTPPDVGGALVDRGGSWSFDPNRSRAAARGRVDAAWQSNFQGFRPFRSWPG